MIINLLLALFIGLIISEIILLKDFKYFLINIIANANLFEIKYLKWFEVLSFQFDINSIDIQIIDRASYKMVEKIIIIKSEDQYLEIYTFKNFIYGDKLIETMEEFYNLLISFRNNIQ